MSSHHDPIPTTDLFVANLNRLIDDRWGVAARLADFCELSRGAITKWRDGETFPLPSSIDRIAMFFRVSVSDLFEEPKKKAKVRRVS